MQSISDALNLLFEDGSWFARATRLRLWLVRCEASLRNSVLELVPRLEFHADNYSAWPVLLDAHTLADDGWQLRANNLVADWQRRVDAFAAEGIEQRSAALGAGSTPFERFCTTSAAVLGAMAAPLEGLVLVLAPTIVEQLTSFERELGMLLAAPGLARCRLVVVLDLDLPPPRALLDALGERALVTTCRIDPAAQRRDLKAMLQAGDAKQLGTAWPVGVVPPRRVDEPPALAPAERDALLRSAGLDPAYLDRAPEIRAKVLGAAVMMSEGRGAEAVELQREACRLCAELELHELQVVTQTALASYLSGLDHRREAKLEVHAAVELARAHELPRSESQALLALGLLHNLDREHDLAIQAYADSGRAAEAAKEPALAIEAWRMAGQLAAAHGQDQAAVDCFSHALQVAEAAPKQELQATSAAEAARALAAVYERHGMTAQAASLHAQADAIETNEEASDARE